MTASPLRELAADIRPDDARSDVYAVSNAQLTAWADKLESLAGEYAVVLRRDLIGLCEAADILCRGRFGVPLNDKSINDTCRAALMRDAKVTIEAYLEAFADDLRAAARWIDDSCGERTEIGDGLRAHADLLERVQREMRVEYNLTADGRIEEWADALAGDLK